MCYTIVAVSIFKIRTWSNLLHIQSSDCLYLNSPAPKSSKCHQTQNLDRTHLLVYFKWRANILFVWFYNLSIFIYLFFSDLTWRNNLSEILPYPVRFFIYDVDFPIPCFSISMYIKVLNSITYRIWTNGHSQWHKMYCTLELIILKLPRF